MKNVFAKPVMLAAIAASIMFISLPLLAQSGDASSTTNSSSPVPSNPASQPFVTDGVTSPADGVVGDVASQPPSPDAAQNMDSMSSPTETSSEGPMTESAADAIENPYGLKALWAQGDFVSKTTLIILAIMSMGSWYIIVIKLWEQRALMAEARSVSKKIAAAGGIQAGVEKLSKSSVFRAVADEGFLAAQQYEKGLAGEVTLVEWSNASLTRTLDVAGSRFQNGLAFLATVGSTAPFVGLFGTVWGIYHALIAIGVAGQASIDKVAGPVGEALIMTAIGLAVAVPAVLGYNWLVRRNKAALEALRRFSYDVLLQILQSGSGDVQKRAVAGR
ncbi:MAG: MotA/TolQ/ExbB proton channel family protein [Parvibaculum sp.]|uniref:MotA/TolQ/ExbB proton channel family protein n=1 Tax=Parvibaculum sp. TaxID=2024848 RepID=UPI003C71219E